MAEREGDGSGTSRWGKAGGNAEIERQIKREGEPGRGESLAHARLSSFVSQQNHIPWRWGVQGSAKSRASWGMACSFKEASSGGQFATPISPASVHRMLS